WGPGVCGDSAAAHYYFDKSVDELTVVEAAWMAGLLRNPDRADPNLAVRSKRTYWIVDQMITIPRARRNAALEELSRMDDRTS
ncbi:MAG: transglycosylase domain-containing protein, partial [Woeseiaceae bacterium]|nr:transglycosylase domain-containing protein [Woeseiaceae bacterium]